MVLGKSIYSVLVNLDRLVIQMYIPIVGITMLTDRHTAERIHSVTDLVEQWETYGNITAGCIAGGSTMTFFRVRIQEERNLIILSHSIREWRSHSDVVVMGFPFLSKNKMCNENVNPKKCESSLVKKI